MGVNTLEAEAEVRSAYVPIRAVIVGDAAEVVLWDVGARALLTSVEGTFDAVVAFFIRCTAILDGRIFTFEIRVADVLSADVEIRALRVLRAFHTEALGVVGLAYHASEGALVTSRHITGTRTISVVFTFPGLAKPLYAVFVSTIL